MLVGQEGTKSDRHQSSDPTKSKDTSRQYLRGILTSANTARQVFRSGPERQTIEFVHGRFFQTYTTSCGKQRCFSQDLGEELRGRTQELQELQELFSEAKGEKLRLLSVNDAAADLGGTQEYREEGKAGRFTYDSCRFIL
jgi:hypothetical protein